MVSGCSVMPGEFAYEYHYVCACGCELETDDLGAMERMQCLHKDCKAPETEALALLTRLVTAAETIVEHGSRRYEDQKQ